MPDSDVQTVSPTEAQVADNQTQTQDNQTAAQDGQSTPAAEAKPDPRLAELQRKLGEQQNINRQAMDRLFETSIASLPPDQQAVRRANYESQKLQSARAEEEQALNLVAKDATAIIMANKYGINKDDLMDMDSPELMEAKAQLLKERKDLQAQTITDDGGRRDLTNPPNNGASQVLDLAQFRNSGDVTGWLKAKRAVGEYD